MSPQKQFFSSSLQKMEKLQEMVVGGANCNLWRRPSQNDNHTGSRQNHDQLVVLHWQSRGSQVNLEI